VTPRSYSQDRRAESAAATRQRILDAAHALFREAGVSATTLTAIATRADVSRGTVINHFGGFDGLLDALLDEVADRLVYPSEQVLTSATDDSERIHRYVEAMFGFFVRSADDWAAFSRDMDHPILREREAHYSAIVARLYAATFGDLAEDRLVAAAARAYVNYAPLDDLRGAGLSLEEAVGVVAGSLAALVRERRTQAQQEANRGQGGGSR
jgi:AcrR family transcriptional regulator